MEIRLQSFISGDKLVISNKLSKLYSKQTIFRDKDYLKKGHHPHSLDEVLHRDHIIDIYTNCLRDVMHGSVPDNIFVYGTYGTGKTMLTKLITSEIALAAEMEGYKVLVIYIFCESYSAPSPLLRHINQELINSISELENKMVGTSISRNFEYFCELVNLISIPIILIFDEIDKLNNPDIINQLSRIKECGFTQNNICIIGITNDTVFYDNLDGRTKSIIGQNELFIPPYNAEELADILTARANLAFEDEVCEDVVIPLCAAFGAQENGDARKAMDLLRLSGENAELRSSLKICEQDVKVAKGKVEINRQAEVVRKLPTQTKAVLFACTHRYEITGSNLETTEIYNSYIKIAEVISLDTVTLRRVGDYISELASIGILSINKISRGRRRGVVNFVKPITDTHIIEQTILQDPRFEELQRKRKFSFNASFDV